MVIVIGSFAATSNVSLFLDHLENSVGISVHIEDDLTEGQVELLYRQLVAANHVISARFVSPAEALAALLENLGDTGMLFEVLEDEADDLLRRTFALQLDSARNQRQVAEQVEMFFGVYRVIAPIEETETLMSLNNFLGILGFVVIMILGILSVVIITNTIKLTVNNRRDEIIIMKYVGATDWFIKWPFVIEGILIGIIGGLVPLVILWFTYEHLVYGIRNSNLFILMFTGMLNQPPFRETREIFPIIAPVILVLGAAIGVLGSITSMRKHLNV